MSVAYASGSLRESQEDIMPRRAHVLLALCVPMLLLLRTAPVGAELECPQPVVDKGEVRSGLSLSHRFTFCNRGPEAVEITDVRPSCGCLAPKLEKRNFQASES